jgi:hypothetical protein
MCSKLTGARGTAIFRVLEATLPALRQRFEPDVAIRDNSEREYLGEQYQQHT